MSTSISSSDLVGQWSLSFADIDFLNSKPAATRLGFSAQLKFFSARGFFADDSVLVSHDAAEYLINTLLLGESVKQANPAANAFVKARQVVLLVGRMNSVIILGETDKEGVHAQNALEFTSNGN